MSLRLQMLRAARRARRLRPDLADGALAFLRTAALPGGAFPDRSGKADLYYTVFGLLGTLAAAPAGAASLSTNSAGAGCPHPAPSSAPTDCQDSPRVRGEDAPHATCNNEE
jgi:hypothetical protein